MKSILKLIEGLSTIVPIITVEEGTYQIANEIGGIKSKIYSRHRIIYNYFVINLTI